MLVTKKPGEASLYLQLAESIKKDLFSLNYGDQIPSEIELIERYGVSRGTVRQAVNLLVSSGFLYKLPGKGTFKGNGLVNVDAQNYIPSFTSCMINEGRIPAIADICLRVIKANAEIASNLSIPLGTDVWNLTRFRGAAGEMPVCFASAYLVKDYFPNLVATDLEMSIVSMITNRFKIKLSVATNIISAVPADENMAAQAGIEVGRTVLKTNFILRDHTGRPILYDIAFNWEPAFKYIIQSEII